MKKIIMLLLAVGITMACAKNENENTTTETDNCENKVQAYDDSVVVTACSNYEFTFPSKKPALLELRIKDDVATKISYYIPAPFDSWTNIVSLNGMALQSDGYYAELRQAEGLWDGLKIETQGKVQIIARYIPENKTCDAKPHSYSGKGSWVCGPVQLASGDRILAECVDTKGAIFNVQFASATTGEKIDSLATKIINYDGGTINPNFSTNVKFYNEGKFYLIVTTNQNAEWDIDIQ